MADQQWEYCILTATHLGVTTTEHASEVEFHLAELSVTFSSVGSATWRKLADPIPGRHHQDPFNLALGNLGAAEWELVEVQNGAPLGAPPIVDASGTTAVGTQGFARVAYFKRSVVAERPVDQPVTLFYAPL